MVFVVDVVHLLFLYGVSTITVLVMPRIESDVQFVTFLSFTGKGF